MTHEEKIKIACRELDEARETVIAEALEVIDSSNLTDRQKVEIISAAVKEWRYAGEKLHKLLRVPADITTAMKV